jgi:hypothetical protein
LLQGLPGKAGPAGAPGAKGEEGGSGGVVFTRWGRKHCPQTSGTNELYSGIEKLFLNKKRAESLKPGSHMPAGCGMTAGYCRYQFNQIIYKNVPINSYKQ